MAGTVERAVDSALQQTYQKLEIIVVDDGSSDESTEILSRYRDPRMLMLKRNNGGRSRALNQGIEQARGEYITFLDADDELPPTSIQDRVEYLKTHPTFDAAYGNTEYRSRYNSSVRRSKQYGEPQQLLEAILGEVLVPFSLPNTLYRTSAVKETGFFNPHFKRGQDMEFIARFLVSGHHLGLVDKTTYIYYNDIQDTKTRLRNRVRGALSKARIITEHSDGLSRVRYLAKHVGVTAAKLAVELVTGQK